MVSFSNCLAFAVLAGCNDMEYLFIDMSPQ